MRVSAAEFTTKNAHPSDFVHATDRSWHTAARRRAAPVLRAKNQRSRLHRTSSKCPVSRTAPRRHPHPARRTHRTSRARAPRRDPKDLP
ncbi:hypothetical protein EGY19_22580 [Burkholderia multivorans]|nr:hypothetical protein EGY19_22580 [Burkholderia multivorans]PRF49845.1 hypothetical protein C6Q04_05820 [Burkholderia multivorans]PRG48338.1 hypothetical protein C6T63_24045 [Burkholderia multivorans]